MTGAPTTPRPGGAGTPIDRIDVVTSSTSHLVLIPSYNSGAKLIETVAAAQVHWRPVWVVIDGSSDGSGERLAAKKRDDRGLRVLWRDENGGKGAAVLDGLRAAAAAGFSHVLVMDADGQHPAAAIPEFMRLSRARPEAMILGVPVFDRTAPRLRIVGRQVSNTLVRLETLADMGDSLFGFRVYPLVPLRRFMEASRFMRRFDFDAEAVVRLSWAGVPAVKVPVPVRYFPAAEGGVSHFRYARDNALLAMMHARLLAGFLARLPQLKARRVKPSHR